MTKEKVLKLQLNAARMEVEDLGRRIEELEEQAKVLFAHVKDNKIPPPSAFKWDNASPIDLEQVEAAL